MSRCSYRKCGIRDVLHIHVLVAGVQQELREMEAESSPKQSTSGAAGDTISDCAAKGLLLSYPGGAQ